jgi:hypothetical protein
VEPALETLRLVHLTLGFATGFAVAPVALLARPGSRSHRRAGKVYVVAMCTLLASGLVFTFTKHEPFSYAWTRNIAFNCFGLTLIFPGLRALRLELEGRRFVLRPVDRALQVLIALESLAMLSVGHRKWPFYAFAALGAGLLWLDARECREAEHAPSRVDRHARYLLASYFFLLTVVSLLYGPRGSELKWIWPLALGLPITALATSAHWRARFRLSRAEANRWGQRGTAVVALAVALAVVAIEATTDGKIRGQSADLTPRSPTIAAAP